MLRSLCIVALALAITGTGSLARAAEPVRAIPYSGQIAVDGDLQSIQLDMTFKIFDAATNGNLLFEEPFPDVPVSAGAFAVVLGAGATPVGAAVYEAAAVFVEVTIEGATLSPRQQIFAAPQAVRVGTQQDLTVTNELVVGNNPAGAATVRGLGRLHVASAENLYLLAVNGVHITNNWGASGNLNVSGTATVGALSSPGSVQAKLLSADSVITTQSSIIGPNSMVSGDLSVMGNLAATGNVTASGNLNVGGTTTLGVVKHQCNASAWYVEDCICPSGTQILSGGVYCEPGSIPAFSYPKSATSWKAGCTTSVPAQTWWGNTWVHLLCARIQ